MIVGFLVCMSWSFKCCWSLWSKNLPTNNLMCSPNGTLFANSSLTMFHMARGLRCKIDANFNQLFASFKFKIFLACWNCLIVTKKFPVCHHFDLQWHKLQNYFWPALTFKVWKSLALKIWNPRNKLINVSASTGNIGVGIRFAHGREEIRVRS